LTTYKHTPGPWFSMCISDEIKPARKGSRDCHCGYIFDSMDCEKTVAKVLHNDPRLPDYEPMEGELPVEEKNANAHLITVAPEMYKELDVACSQALAQFKAGDRHATFNRQTVDAWGAVLAKARGES
jgi:hypothetical protein